MGKLLPCPPFPPHHHLPPRCWASYHQRHHTPTWVQRGAVLRHCLGSGPRETSLWSSLAWPGPGTSRNSNKPTQAKPRDIPLWRFILTLIWPNLCLFRDQLTLLATYQETLLRPASCWPPPPLSFRPHSVCISAPTQPENKSLYGEGMIVDGLMPCSHLTVQVQTFWTSYYQKCWIPASSFYCGKPNHTNMLGRSIRHGLYHQLPLNHIEMCTNYKLNQFFKTI